MRHRYDYAGIVRAVGLLGLTLVLAGCSRSGSDVSGLSGDGWRRWVCDNKTVIDWRYVGNSKKSVELRLGKPPTHHLEQEYAAVGVLYTDRRIGFHMENNQGLVYWVETDEIIGRQCK